MFIDPSIDFLSLRLSEHTRPQAFYVQSEPTGHSAFVQKFNPILEKPILPAPFPHHDVILCLDDIRGRIHSMTIDHEMTVLNQLTSLRPRVGKSKSVNDVIQSTFQQDEDILPSHTGQSFGLSEITAELPLQHTINAPYFLLLP